MGFLKTILIILLGYYFLKVLAKWFAPRIFTYAAKRSAKHFHEQFDQFQGRANDQQDPSGDTIIDSNSNSKKVKKPAKIVGEYIDFEEIK
jgi:hypothetical protein